MTIKVERKLRNDRVCDEECGETVLTVAIQNVQYSTVLCHMLEHNVEHTVATPYQQMCMV